LFQTGLTITYSTDGNHSGSGSGSSGSGSDGNTTSKSSSQNVGILAGAIAGGIVLLLAILALAICLRRRKKNNTSAPEQHPNQPPTGYSATPFGPSFPHNPHPQMQVNPYAVPIMPPWPQPQSPGPNYLPTTAAGVGIGAMGAGNRTSVASSGTPLVSPGISSTYSGSGSSPGWTNTSTPSHEAPGFRPMGGFGFDASGGMSVRSGASMVASGSNVAVEAGGSSSRFDAGSSVRHGAVSPAPPAYDQGGYMTSDVGKG
jgi:hypothetical protein